MHEPGSVEVVARNSSWPRQVQVRKPHNPTPSRTTACRRACYSVSRRICTSAPCH
jgi:hypothetical protein